MWITPNTPGTRVPSHGTSDFGETYAIDFVMIQDNDSFKKPYQRSFLEYLFQGLALDDFYGWGQTIYSPIDGEVIEIKNDIAERNPVNIFKDFSNTLKVTRDFTQGSVPLASITGNYVLLKCSDDIYALFAHLQKGSIIVKPGQRIRVNQPLGQLGHSGNSTMPHLHMQFMSSSNYKVAQGIPFVFREYEVKRNSKWEKVCNSIPTAKDIIRH